jgi:hypothetical protein
MTKSGATRYRGGNTLPLAVRGNDKKWSHLLSRCTILALAAYTLPLGVRGNDKKVVTPLSRCTTLALVALRCRQPHSRVDGYRRSYRIDNAGFSPAGTTGKALPAL